MGGADRGLEPELPGAAGVPVEDTDDAHVEGARILVDQARPRLRERGFSDEEIREWAEAFLREEGSGGAEDLLAWIARREGGRR